MIFGLGIGFVLKNGVFFGGLDILSIIIWKKMGCFVGLILIYFNVLIVFVVGYLFGW